MMMAITVLALALIIILILKKGCFCYMKMMMRAGKKRVIPREWAVVGMLPALLHNAHRIHEFMTDFLKESGGTFEFKGAVFGNLDMLMTCDPANIHHILTRNFSNYPKGPHFKKIFDVFGDGVFNVDSQLWELHRKTILSFTNHAHLHTLLETTLWHKRGVEFDLQDVFQRFSFDTICKMVVQEDPGSLSVDLPYVPCEKGFNHLVDAILYRHILPETCWRLQKWLGIGKEKKLIQAWQAFDEFIYSSIVRLSSTNNNNQDDGDDFSLFTAYVKANQDDDSVKFVRDSLLSLMFAGRDTTSTTLTWLFYLLAQNPLVQAKIRDEIDEKLNLKRDEFFVKVDECHELVYLHGALCETLRLFPPVGLEHKVSAEMDVLPSGHVVKPNTRIIMSFYSTGRMDSIWGEDCLEFKPERWISETGRIKHQPSYKFPAFNAGPRSCLGKEISLIQMKMVAAIILQRYHFQVMDSHSVSPSDSLIIQAKHGLKVKFTKR